MQTFRNLLKTDEAALTAADIDVIFCGIEELHGAHDLFVTELQPLVDSWSDEQRVAEPIKVLVSLPGFTWPCPCSPIVKPLGRHVQ